eukprot:scaffold25637_cov74-Skeletonema_marinoi.AAC.1
MNHKNDNDWYEGLERMDHSAPSTATAKTLSMLISLCCVHSVAVALEARRIAENRLCDLWGQNGCLRLQRL